MEGNFNLEVDLGGDFPMLFLPDVPDDSTITQDGNIIF
jgi:hypothetical protein